MQPRALKVVVFLSVGLCRLVWLRRWATMLAGSRWRPRLFVRREGMLHCWRKGWRGPVESRHGQRLRVIQNFFGVGSTPVVYNDLLIVMVGGSPPESAQVAPGSSIWWNPMDRL